MQRWYVNRTGQPEGPFDEAMVIETIRAGHVAPNAQICAEGGAAWLPIGTHPPFASAMPQAPDVPLQPVDLGGKGSVSGGSTPGGKRDVKRVAIVGVFVVGLLGCCVTGIVVFRKGGFASAATSIAQDVVRYGLKGEDVAGEWINDPLEGSGANVYATDHAAIAASLAPLGASPEIAAVGYSYTLCGTANSVHVEVALVDGETVIASVAPRPGENCLARMTDDRGRPVHTDAAAEDDRIKALGVFGESLWESMRAPECDLVPLTAEMLTDEGVPAAVAANLVASGLPERIRAACTLVAADPAVGGTSEAYVRVEGIQVLLVGESHVGGLSARIARSGFTYDFHTLGAISGRLMQ